MKIKIILSTIFALSSLSTLAVSTCSYGKKIVSNRNTNQSYYWASDYRSGDRKYKKAICNSSRIGKWWRDFGMERSYWDGGMGYYDVCNTKKPLGRIFSSMYVLQNSGRSSLGRNNFLNTAYDFSHKNTQKLRVNCGDGFKRAEYEWYYKLTWKGLRTRNRMMFYWPGIYNMNVVDRAGTIVHEARHRHKNHNAGKRCSAKGSCDSHWSYYGANTYKAIYLWWYGLYASNSNSAMKRRALYDAQWIVDNRFRSKPNYKIYK